MKTRLISSLVALAALVLLIPVVSNAQSITPTITTLLANQTFTGAFPPASWTSSGTTSGNPDNDLIGTYWYQSTGGNGGVGGTYGSAVAWTPGAWNMNAYGNNTDGYYCGPLTLTTPAITTNSNDSQYVDFDLWYPYGVYMTAYVGMETHVEVLANTSNTVCLYLSGGSEVYGNCTFTPSPYNFPAGEDPANYSSSSYWQHYHVALPYGVTSQTVTFEVTHGGPDSNTYEMWYTDNVAFTNVVVTNVHYPSLTVTPTSFNFGLVPVNQSAGPYYVYLTNPNSIPLNVSNYGFSGTNPGDFSLTRQPSSVPAGGKDSIGILYTPKGTGTRAGILTFSQNGVPTSFNITLTGSGSAPTASYNTNALFRQVYTELTDTSAVQYLYVTAVGTIPLTVSSVYFYGLNSNSYIVTHLPATPIPGGVTDSIGVRFTPTVEGKPDATMVIVSNAANIPIDTVTLNGIGILPRLVINNTYINNTPSNNSNTVYMPFGAVNVGADSCMFITLVNPGSDTLAIEKNFFASADYDFTMTPLTGAADTILLPGGGSQQIQVCFNPLKQGDRTATVRITTNIPHTISNPTRDTSAFFVVITGTGVPFGHLAITGPDTIPVSPVGTKLCWEDTLWNTGLAAVQVNSGAISGTDASEFTNSGLTFPLTLQPSTFQTFDVCGNPTADSTQTALFTATGTTGGEGGIPDTISASIPLNIFGTTVCDSLHWVTNFPASTCFGTTDTAVISVTNCGNVATPYSASISGADAAMFAVLNPATSSSESGGGVAMFKITYTPDTVQTDVTSTAVFNIAGGANGTLPLSATRGAAIIAGTGTAPLTPVGSSPVSFTVIVKNTGNCDWNPGTPAVSSPFAYVSGAASIPPNGTDTLTFTFAPASAGTFTQQVTFQNSVGVSVPWANVSVSGTAGTSSVPMVSAQNGYSIDQSYPNPNNGTSNVEITLPTAGNVHLAILDITGNVVQNVLDQQEGAGSFTVTIKANDLASGTYFYQMTSGGVTLTRQMSIVK